MDKARLLGTSYLGLHYEASRTRCFIDDPSAGETGEPTPTTPAPPPAGGDAPAPEPGEGEGDGGKAAPEPEPAPGPEPPAGASPQAAVPWYEKRIAKLTAQLAEERGKKAAAPPTGYRTQAEFDAAVAQRATQEAAAREWDQKCEAVAAEGRRVYPDFEGKVNSILRLVDRNNPGEWNNYLQFLATAIETGKGHDIIHKLGSDLNEASRILSMPAAKMAVEVTKMSLVDDGSNRVSNAPKPITPVGSRGAQHTSIAPDDPENADKLSTAEWMARREAQVAARWKAQGGRG